MADSQKHRIFISYSHADRGFLDELTTHVRALGEIDIWSDTRINAGENWQNQISSEIQSADAAIILVSADYLASQFITEYELPHLLASARDRGVLILPLLIRPCLWERSPLVEYQFLNPPNQPLAELPRAKREATLVRVARELSSLFSSQDEERDPAPVPPEKPAELADQIAKQVYDMLKSDLPTLANSRSEDSSDSDVGDPNLVFVICAFSDDMESAFKGIEAAANNHGLKAKRVKDVLGDYRITSKIMSMITTSRFVVADLTHERPNVYFELGFARGLGKTVITCARKGTNIHFDVSDWTYIPYDDSRALEVALNDRLRFELEKEA